MITDTRKFRWEDRASRIVSPREAQPSRLPCYPLIRAMAS